MEQTEIVLSIYELVGILIAVLAGGLGAGGFIVITFAQRVMDSPSGIKAVEALGNSIPQEHGNKLLEVIRFLREGDVVLEVIEEALDGVPHEEKAEEA